MGNEKVKIMVISKKICRPNVCRPNVLTHDRTLFRCIHYYTSNYVWSLSQL